MLILRNLFLSFVDRVLFDNINVSIAYDEKIGVLGRNGAGKSTLLNIIARQQQPDSGSIAYNKNKTIGFLPQEVVLQSTQSVFDETFSVFSTFLQLQEQIKEIEDCLTAGVDDETAQRLTDQYTTMQEQLAQFDEYNAKAKTERILQGLGFSENSFNQSVDTMSIG